MDLYLRKVRPPSGSRQLPRHSQRRRLGARDRLDRHPARERPYEAWVWAIDIVMREITAPPLPPQASAVEGIICRRATFHDSLFVTVPADQHTRQIRQIRKMNLINSLR